MKTAGIICEYNPFHTGHKYHIEQTRKQTGADAIVCVMSGNFTQRGDAAIANKFLRAKAAVLGGADLVLELPCAFSISCAENFALGGVSILNAINADFISFGAECKSLEKLISLSDILVSEPESFKNILSERLNLGESYPKARAYAAKSIFPNAEKIMSKPNNSLALEYLSALKKTGSKISPVLVLRKGAGYNDNTLNKMYASASGIRNALLESNDILSYIPQETHEVFSEIIKNPVYTKSFNDIAVYKLRTCGAEYLKNINDVSEGLENRIIQAAKKLNSIEEIISSCASKRYTKNRISRIIFAAIIGIEKDFQKDINYLRPLAMNETGAKLLSSIKKNSPLPIITKLANYNGDMSLLKYDILASDIYNIVKGESGASDYTNSPYVAGKKNYVYILKCADNTLYTGWTTDLDARLKAHNSKSGAKYTKARTPVELVYFEEFKTKSEALKREYEIKQLSKKKKEELISKKEANS